MWRQDIRGSLAHARMLARQGIIGAADLAAIEQRHGRHRRRNRRRVVQLESRRRGCASQHREAPDRLVGDAGKRLHTGRSRNDQVATDIRLWLRDTIDEIDGLLRNLQKALLDTAEHTRTRPCPASPTFRWRSR
jgi:argininosuccinate lyase